MSDLDRGRSPTVHARVTRSRSKSVARESNKESFVSQEAPLLPSISENDDLDLYGLSDSNDAAILQAMAELTKDSILASSTSERPLIGHSHPFKMSAASKDPQGSQPAPGSDAIYVPIGTLPTFENMIIAALAELGPSTADEVMNFMQLHWHALGNFRKMALHAIAQSYHAGRIAKVELPGEIGPDFLPGEPRRCLALVDGWIGGATSIARPTERNLRIPKRPLSLPQALNFIATPTPSDFATDIVLATTLAESLADITAQAAELVGDLDLQTTEVMLANFAALKAKLKAAYAEQNGDALDVEEQRIVLDMPLDPSSRHSADGPMELAPHVGEPIYNVDPNYVEPVGYGGSDKRRGGIIPRKRTAASRKRGRPRKAQVTDMVASQSSQGEDGDGLRHGNADALTDGRDQVESLPQDA